MKMWQKIFTAAGVVCLAVGAAYGGYRLAKYEPPQKEEELKDLDTINQIYDSVFESYTDTNYSLDNIHTISDARPADIVKEDVPFSKDSFYVTKVSHQDKDDEELKDYEEAHDKYLANLIKVAKENLSYKIKKEEKLSEISLNQTVTIKSYNMYLYKADFMAVYNSLLDAYYNQSEIVSKTDEMSEQKKQEFKINSYKAKVKTFEIMNNELDRYKNSKEKDVLIQYMNNGTVDSPKWRCVNPFDVFNAITNGDGNTESINDIKRIQDIFAKSYNEMVNTKDYLKLGKPEK